MKILVIDDEQDICEILQYNLETEGFEVMTANSAEEAFCHSIRQPHCACCRALLCRVDTLASGRQHLHLLCHCPDPVAGHRALSGYSPATPRQRHHPVASSAPAYRSPRRCKPNLQHLPQPHRQRHILRDRCLASCHCLQRGRIRRPPFL